MKNKKELIAKSVENFKNLKPEDKMFILGYSLAVQKESKKRDEETT